jgi:chromatin remodeling complex protein RSC6
MLNILTNRQSYLLLDTEQRISFVRKLRTLRQEHFEEAKRKRIAKKNNRKSAKPRKKPVDISPELANIFEGLTPEMRKLVLKG